MNPKTLNKRPSRRKSLRSVRSFLKKHHTRKRTSNRSGAVPNLLAIHLSENRKWNNYELGNSDNVVHCRLPGMTRDAVKELPDSEITELLNKYGPTFTCSMSDRKGCPAYRLLTRMNQKGIYGSTFKSCCKDSCNYVTKVVYFKMHNNNHPYGERHVPEDIHQVEKEEFMNEITMQAKAAALGIAPPIRKVLLSASKGIVIMDSMKEDLEDVITRFVLDPATTADDAYELGMKIANELGPLIMKLHSHNIIHGDIHQNNVMFDHHGHCKLIDYGLSIPVPIEFLAEEYTHNGDISNQIMDAYQSDYKLSIDGTRHRGFTETRVFQINDSMPTKVKLRTFFMALRDGLDEWLEKDMDKLTERVKKYVETKNLQ